MSSTEEPRDPKTLSEFDRVGKIARDHGCTLEPGDDGQGNPLYVLIDDRGRFRKGCSDLREAEATARKAETLREELSDD